jgi:hypothetical protein
MAASASTLGWLCVVLCSVSVCVSHAARSGAVLKDLTQAVLARQCWPALNLFFVVFMKRRCVRMESAQVAARVCCADLSVVCYLLGQHTGVQACVGACCGLCVRRPGRGGPNQQHMAFAALCFVIQLQAC